MKTTVEIEDSLLGEAKRFAASRGLTLGQVIERALRDHIRFERPTRQFQLKKHSFRGDGLVKGFNWPLIRDEVYRGPGA